jgi:hypothetical protein
MSEITPESWLAHGLGQASTPASGAAGPPSDEALDSLKRLLCEVFGFTQVWRYAGDDWFANTVGPIEDRPMPEVSLRAALASAEQRARTQAEAIASLAAAARHMTEVIDEEWGECGPCGESDCARCQAKAATRALGASPEGRGSATP